MSAVSENDLEQTLLTWFAALGYEVLASDHLRPDSVYDERTSFEDVVLKGRLEAALHRLNPDVPVEALDEALRKLARHDAPTLEQNNYAFHRLLVDGIPLEIPRDGGGPPRGVLVRLFDFDDPAENDWMVVNQVTIVDRVTGTGQSRIPDVIVYVNGLPLAVIELKNPSDPDANMWDAYGQLVTYKKDIPALFVANAALVISDDVHARVGSLTAGDSRFAVWRTVGGEGDEPAHAQPLKVLVHGLFDKERFSDWLRNFVTFEQDEQGRLVKKVAGYHQFHAVRRAVLETVRASAAKGDRRIGVVWHTQGSGKSLSMVFYARKLVVEPAMENPTIVVLTDRNDLDDQLFATFSQAQPLLRQAPHHAESRAALRELLNVASGGVFFTTVQKFLPDPGERHPALSERRNIVVIADEAHRSQYGFKGRVDTKTGDLVYGFAKHMRDALPNASFIGFTGTPVELEDKSTAQVFGDTISVYDMRRAVDDRATVPITYENRLARIDLDEAERPRIDPAFDEVTEGEEEDKAEALKSEWATVEALVGTEKRLALVAADIVAHFEKRQGAMTGKALVVCMSRRICVDLYDQIVKLRPAWHDREDAAGKIKVVMTGSAADDPRYQPHLRSKAARPQLQRRYKDPADPLEIVIVRDMWLTGFDAPCMHTLYVDKPMRGHNLMQAIARVNRVFGDKPGGLVVDYIGLATSLREAMKTYSARGGTGDATERQDQAVDVMMAQLERCRRVFHGFDYAGFFTAAPAARLELLPRAREHVLAQRLPKGEDAAAGTKAKRPRPGGHVERDGYDTFLSAVGALSSAFAIASPHETCDEVRDEVAFFQAIKAGLAKLATGHRAPSEDLGHAVRQIVANSVVTGDVLDVFDAAGIPKPDISILSPEFLAEIAGMKTPNLAAALLQRLLEDEVHARGKRSVVQKRKFSEMLESAIARYQSRTIESAQIIEELIELAKKMRDADAQGERLALAKDEAAFYEALAENESAVTVLGDAQLCEIARELTRVVKNNTSVDWTSKASVQAKLRLAVKSVLKRMGYPPDGQEKAAALVLDQAKALGINLSGVPANDEAHAVSSLPPSHRLRPLPYPIAVFDHLVQSQIDATLRVKTYRDGFEKALSFLTSIGLALVTAQNSGKLPGPALLLLKQVLGKPISMGTWHELAWRLAAMIPAESTDPAARALRTLTTLDGKPSPLMLEVMTGVVKERNDFSHTVTPSAEEVAKAEPGLMDLWRRFKKALAPLAETRLVVRAQLLDFDLAAHSWHYRARLLEGGSNLFQILDVQVNAELREQWCYLLREDAPPLSLAPIVFCAHSDKTSQHEVFVARKIPSLEPGAKTDGVGVASASAMRFG